MVIERVSTPHGTVEVRTEKGAVYSRPDAGTVWKPNPYAKKEYLLSALKAGVYRG